MKFKAVLFDAGDVLYHRPRRGKGLAAFLAQHGLSSATPDGRRLADLKRRAHAGEITRETYQDTVLELHGVSNPALKLDGRSIMDEEQRDIEFFEGVPETLKRLKAAGLRLGVVTNTYDATADKLEWFRRAGIDSVWDGFATSCELKVCKPDARIYLAALNPLGVQSKEAAFVGHAAVELQGAKALGMTTIAFNRDDERVRGDHVISSFTELLPLVGV
jgi:HAD superfamily hydrolase (TIGR01509 family)